MRITRNDKMISRRARFGTYASLAGMAILIGGFAISIFAQQYLYLSMVALILGFGLSQFGGYNMRRFGTVRRPDMLLADEMKGFDDRYHFYAWELPVPYVLLSPQGVYAFSTRDQNGPVTVRGDRFRQKFSLGRAFFFLAQEGLGNPAQEAQANAARLQKLIQQDLPETPVQIQPAVVFINPDVQLDVDEPAVPILDLKSLKKWLRGTGKGGALKNADYRALEKALDARAGRA